MVHIVAQKHPQRRLLRSVQRHRGGHLPQPYHSLTEVEAPVKVGVKQGEQLAHAPVRCSGLQVGAGHAWPHGAREALRIMPCCLAEGCQGSHSAASDAGWLLLVMLALPVLLADRAGVASAARCCRRGAIAGSCGTHLDGVLDGRRAGPATVWQRAGGCAGQVMCWPGVGQHQQLSPVLEVAAWGAEANNADTRKTHSVPYAADGCADADGSSRPTAVAAAAAAAQLQPVPAASAASWHGHERGSSGSCCPRMMAAKMGDGPCSVCPAAGPHLPW
jgi:hypothetical protein